MRAGGGAIGGAAAGGIRVRGELIGRLQPCMPEIYLHIVARMADYMDTHPYMLKIADL